MCECGFELVVGRKYKVRLKPLEELLVEYPEGDGVLFTGDKGCWDVTSPYHTTNSKGEGLCVWFSRYLDGSVGYFTYSGDDGDSVVVCWDVDGDEWHYDLGMLKVLGEV